MPIATLLPLIFSGIGALANGYKFLEMVEAKHPGSKVTAQHMDELRKIDPETHAFVAAQLAGWSSMTPSQREAMQNLATIGVHTD